MFRRYFVDIYFKPDMNFYRKMILNKTRNLVEFIASDQRWQRN